MMSYAITISKDEARYRTVYLLSEEQALFVEGLRTEGFTWRAIARSFAEKYPAFGVYPGDQLDGMDLCASASRVLGRLVCGDASNSFDHDHPERTLDAAWYAPESNENEERGR